LDIALDTASKTCRVGSPSTAVPLVAAARPKKASPAATMSTPTRCATLRTNSNSARALAASPVTAVKPALSFSTSAAACTNSRAVKPTPSAPAACPASRLMSSSDTPSFLLCASACCAAFS